MSAIDIRILTFACCLSESNFSRQYFSRLRICFGSRESSFFCFASMVRMLVIPWSLCTCKGIYQVGFLSLLEDYVFVFVKKHFALDFVNVGPHTLGILRYRTPVLILVREVGYVTYRADFFPVVCGERLLQNEKNLLLEVPYLPGTLEHVQFPVTLRLLFGVEFTVLGLGLDVLVFRSARSRYRRRGLSRLLRRFFFPHREDVVVLLVRNSHGFSSLRI